MKFENEWFTDTLPDFIKERLDNEATASVNSIKSKYSSFHASGKRADPFAARKIFLLTFLKDNEMRESFLRAFGIYTQINLNRFKDIHGVIYFPENKNCLPGAEIISRGLNLLYNDYLQASQMALDIFVNFYKDYYKKEYNQLKRFTYITYDDLNALAKDSDSKITTMCRITFMSEMMNIEIDRTVDMLFLICDDLENKYLHPLSKKQTMTYPSLSNGVDDDLYKECCNKASTYVESSLLKKINKWVRFYNACLNLDDYPSIDAEVYAAESKDLFGILSDVIYILEFLKLPYTEDDLCHYMVLRMIAADYTDRLDYTINSIDTVLGLAFKKEHFDLVDMLRSSAKEEPNKKTEQAPSNPNPVEIKESESLEEQVRELQLKLREKEQDLEYIHGLYAEEKKENIRLKSVEEKNNSSKKELASLRTFVYNLTKEDLDNQAPVSEKEMIESINSCKIAIVGGHVNWLNKMKETLPNIKYFSPDIKATLAPQALKGFERVYFFTDTLCHPQYYKFFGLAESSGVEIDYLHGVNISNTIKKIYSDIN